MLFTELAQALDELAQERVGKDGGQPLRDQDSDRPAPAHRQRSSGRMRRVAKILGYPQDAFEGGLTQALGAVESEGHGGFGDAGRARHLSDGDPGHPTRLLI